MWILNFINWCLLVLMTRLMVLGFLLGWLYTIFVVRWVYVVCSVTLVRTALFTSSNNFLFFFVSPWLRVIGMNMGSLCWKWYLKRYYMIFILAISLVFSSATSINYRSRFNSSSSAHTSPIDFCILTLFLCILGPREKGTSWKMGWTSRGNN